MEGVGDSTLAEVVPLVAKMVWPSFIDARLAGDQLRSTDDPLTLARSEDWQRMLNAASGACCNEILPLSKGTVFLRTLPWPC